MSGVRICSIPGCGKKHKGRGWCSDHLGRWRRWGDPLGGRTARGEAAAFLAQALEHDGPGHVLWPYHTDMTYPTITIDGRPRKVARLVLEAKVGPAPSPRHQAAHKPRECHERLCIAWRHLRWATAKENAADRELDGTTARGERVGGAKLTEAKVARILADKRKPKHVAPFYAAQFGVSPAAVYAILEGRTWKHVPRPVR